MASAGLRVAAKRFQGIDAAKMLDVDGTGKMDRVAFTNTLKRFDEKVFTDSVVTELLMKVGGDASAPVDIKQVAQLLSEASGSNTAAKDPRSESLGSSEADQEAEDDEEERERAKIEKIKNKPRRESISAGRIAQDEVKNYTKPVYEKDASATARIKELLKKNDKVQVLMGHLNDDSFGDVINAFRAKTFDEGCDIIKQGEAGDCLYIIEEGLVDIFVARPGPKGKLEPGEKGTCVVTWEAGALFGELALMYNAPRAATVTAKTNVKTWCLDALDFKMLLMKNTQAQFQKYEGWLSQVPILQSLNHFELSRLADIMDTELFDDGEDIVVQGSVGDKFYIVEDGTAAAYIDGDHGEVKVKQYFEAGQYFGEIALLTDEPRRATVRATGQGCSVVSITKEDFTNMLGPIADILKEDISRYPQYEKYVTNSSPSARGKTKGDTSPSSFWCCAVPP